MKIDEVSTGIELLNSLSRVQNMKCSTTFRIIVKTETSESSRMNLKLSRELQKSFGHYVCRDDHSNFKKNLCCLSYFYSGSSRVHQHTQNHA